jgi:transglutaminase-like putative cysteine protease
MAARKHKKPLTPYSSLPESYLLVAVAVWVGLASITWPHVTETEFLVRVSAYGALLVGAAAHSWFFARRALWSNAPGLVALTAAWLVTAGSFITGLEYFGALPWLGVLAGVQVVQSSFVFNHRTVRLSLLVALGVMLWATPQLPLVEGGIAWLAFALVAMFVLAYDRTARKAGPLGYARGEARRVVSRLATVSTVALVASALFFVLPVLRLPKFPSAPDVAEASRDLRHALGLDGSTGLPTGSQNEQILRVSTDPIVSGPLYIRGRTFDTFGGVNWSNSADEVRMVYLAGEGYTPLRFEAPSVVAASTRPVTQTYEVLADIRDVVFTTFRPDSVRFSDPAIDALRVSKRDRALSVDGTLPARLVYRVNSFQDIFADGSLASVSYRPTDEVTQSDLLVPMNMSPRVADLARQVAANEPTAYRRALAIEDHLRRNYLYSLDHDVHGDQIVDDFLFRARRGHCTLFASSMAMMARSLGLPARYVTGFLAQHQDETGAYVVRGSDGHAWVEIYIEGAGWIPFDPTSSRIDENDATRALLARNEELSTGAASPPPSSTGGMYGRGERPDVGGGGSRDPQRGRDGAAAGEAARADGTTSGSPAGPSESGNGIAGTGGASGRGDDRGTDNGVFLGRNDDEPAPASGEETVARRAESRRGGVIGAPDGTTALPRGSRSLENRAPAAEHLAGKAEAPAPAGVREREKQLAPPDPTKRERDWKFLVWVLLGFGLVSLAGVFVWTRGVRRVAEQRLIRQALPLDPPSDDPDPRRRVVNLYHAMVAGLASVGYRKRDADTPFEYADTVSRRAERLKEPVGEMTELFHLARYGDRTVTRGDADRARDLWRTLARSVKRVASS